MMTKIIHLMLLFLTCCQIGAMAQSPYYYYKGKQIPLKLNEEKICMSIPKDKKDFCETLIQDVSKIDTIKDVDNEIYVIQKSCLKSIQLTESWEKVKKSIMLSPSFRTEEGHEVFLTPYLSVRLKKENDYDLLAKYAEKYRLRIVRGVPFMPLWYVLAVSPGADLNALEVANALWESGDFAASAPDFSSKNVAFCANDPIFNKQWGLYNTDYTGIDISACNAWDLSLGRNVKVAIIDTGIKKNHDDLHDNVLWDLTYNTESGLFSYTDEDYHGTHCAGIVAAIKDNELGVAGVAPESKIIPIYNSLGTSPTIEEELASGIMWACQNGADVISCSWGFPATNSIIDEAIQNAFRYGRNGKGCVVVFATGNSGDSIISYPANCNDTILAVGSIKNTGVRANKSQYGPGLDLVAPGDSIWSTVHDHGYYYHSGTSMACPHVAGVAALVLERNPELTVTQVNSIICRNAKKLSNVDFNISQPDGTWNEQYGYGLVDAYSAVLNTPPAVYIQDETIAGTETISGEYIFVGKDVTDRKQQGEIILGPGDIKLKAKKVTIKNSTTVPLGTKLRIENH